MISCGPVGTSPSSWPSPWTCCCPPKPRPRPVDWTWVDMRLRWNKVTVKKPHSLPVVSEESQAGVPLPSLAERIDGICSANIFVQRQWGNLNIQIIINIQREFKLFAAETGDDISISPTSPGWASEAPTRRAAPGLSWPRTCECWALQEVYRRKIEYR